MPTPFLRRLTWLLLSGGLLAGCQSTKPSFTFRPAPVEAAAPALPPATAPTTAGVAPLLPAAASAPATVAASITPRVVPVAARPAAQSARRARALRQLLRPRALARHQARRPGHSRSESGRNTFHLVLGALLIVGSVLVGLWLGGWLGLGVAVAIMLLGDYFLVLGIGGKHAWLEIFQEFFNM